MFKRPEEIIVLILAVLYCRYVFSRRPVWSGRLYRVKNHCPYPALVCRIIPPLAKKPQPAYLAAAARLPDCLLVAVSESIGRTRFFTLVCIMDVQNHLSPDSRNRRLSV